MESQGQVEIHRRFASRAEGLDRVVRVWTPRQYAQGGHHGVLVMQDGQNVFDHPESACRPTWCVDRTLQQLMDDRRVGPWLVVAVDHGQGRFEDYSPWPEPRARAGGHADRYLHFLVDELLPWARARYRLGDGPAWTATSGSSLGGLFALYAARARPDIFGRIAALSPSVMWGEDGLFRHYREHPRSFTKLYLDAGDSEHCESDGFAMAYGERVKDFHQHLLTLGYGHHEVRCVLDPAGDHDEASWARRLPEALAFALEPYAGA